MNNNKTDSYSILRYIAYISALVASVATYDIAYSFTPDIVLWGLNIRPFVAGLYMVILDGLYLVLDNRLPHMKTTQAREWTIRFLVLVWAIMAGVNVADAALNQTLDTTILGRAGVIVYVLKVIALFYLAYYTFIHYNDPDTQVEIIKRDAAATRVNGVNSFLKKYSQGFADSGAAIIAMNDFADFILEQTGKHPRAIYGDDWELKVSRQVGIDWAGITSQNASSETTQPPQRPQPPQDPMDLDAEGPKDGEPRHQKPGQLERLRGLIPDVLKDKAKRVNASSETAKADRPF